MLLGVEKKHKDSAAEVNFLNMFKASLALHLAFVATTLQHAHALPREDLAPRQLLAGVPRLQLGESQQQSASLGVQGSQIGDGTADLGQSSDSTLSVVSPSASGDRSTASSASNELLAGLIDSEIPRSGIAADGGDQVSAVAGAAADVSADTAQSIPNIVGTDQGPGSVDLSAIATGSLSGVITATLGLDTVATNSDALTNPGSEDLRPSASAIFDVEGIPLAPGIIVLPTLTFSPPSAGVTASPVPSSGLGLDTGNLGNCDSQLALEMLSLMRKIERRVSVVQSQLSSLSSVVAATQLVANSTVSGGQSTSATMNATADLAFNTTASVADLSSAPSASADVADLTSALASADKLFTPVAVLPTTTSLIVGASAIVEASIEAGLAIPAQSIPVFPSAAAAGYDALG